MPKGNPAGYLDSGHAKMKKNLSSMADEKLGRKGKKVMKEHKKGKLRSSSGKKVKDRKQALAIAFSEQRRKK